MNSSSRSAARAPLARISTVDALVEALKQEIFAGRLLAGEPLREVELCDRYGVSRHSLRTALQALVQTGLASREPNRSVLVSHLDAATVEDIYHLRTLIEVDAVSTLVGAPEKQQQAAQALAELQALGAGANWSEVRDHDLAFHAALVSGAGRPRTSAVFASLMDELRLAFLQMQDELEDADDVVAQHARIFELVQSGQKAAAVKEVRRHLNTACHKIAVALGS